MEKLIVTLEFSPQCVAHILSLRQGLLQKEIAQEENLPSSTPHLTLGVFHPSKHLSLIQKVQAYSAPSLCYLDLKLNGYSIFINEAPEGQCYILALLPCFESNLTSLRKPFIKVRSASGYDGWQPHITIAKNLTLLQLQQCLTFLDGFSLLPSLTLNRINLYKGKNLIRNKLLIAPFPEVSIR